MFFSLRGKASKHDTYFLQSKLRGHSGELLGSVQRKTGDFWPAEARTVSRKPEVARNVWASTVFVWIKREDDLSEVLFYGTQNGYLGLAVFEEISCNHVVNPAEITGLSFDAPSNRLAFCHRGGTVQVYFVSKTMSLQIIFTLQLENVTPRAIAFGQIWGNERDIMVFGLYDGHIYTFRGSNGDAAGEPWDVGALIGDIAIDNRKNVLCMDDPSLGTNLYRLEDHTRVKTFTVPVTKQTRLRQVDFLEECKFIVSGSDHGLAYMFDRRSGDIVEELRVDPREWVQTVASRDLVRTNEIFLWRKKSKKRFGGSGIDGLLIVIQLVIVGAALAFAYQNLATVRN
ncbi:hypothetical protein DFH09DRAFT_1115111 [Mycena vulgaris]|nr:hypothetical protein DFH09DRAFT_1115111 [Mycena vulgaris]